MMLYILCIIIVISIIFSRKNSCEYNYEKKKGHIKFDFNVGLEERGHRDLDFSIALHWTYFMIAVSLWVFYGSVSIHNMKGWDNKEIDI